jgi:caspase 8
MNPPYGTALIINVQHFEGTTKEGVTLDLRRGSHIDFENFKQAWTQFDFNVVAKEDLKADEIRTVAEDTANKININSSSFVCVITTHGDRGKIYGSDSEYLEIKEVTDAFKETNCPSLAGKPKLFFIIASGVRQNFTGGSILDPTGGDDYDHLNDAIFREKLDPDESHFLIAISLAPGKLKLTPVVFLAITYAMLHEIVTRKFTNVPGKSLFLSLS